MNKLITFCFLLLSFITYNAYSIYSTDSTIKETGYPFYLFGGVGITNGSSSEFWEKDFKTGPVFNLGVELPILRSRFISLELLNYLWICYYKKDGEPSDDYLKFSNKLYSQYVFAPSLKFQFLSNRNNIQPYIKLGISMFYPSNRKNGFHFGLGSTFKIYDYEFGINYQLVLTGINLTGSQGEFSPNVFNLSFYYNIEWK